jgi:hypothetical protein
MQKLLIDQIIRVPKRVENKFKVSEYSNGIFKLPITVQVDSLLKTPANIGTVAFEIR